MSGSREDTVEQFSIAKAKPESCSYNDFNMDLAVAFLRGMRDQDLLAFTDVTVEVEGENFQCHRHVLSICSGFFRAMFNCDMKESREKRVYLGGISRQTFAVILRCMKETRDCLNTGNFIEIWKAADMLEMLALKDQCEAFAEENICASTCFAIYNTAKSLNVERLMLNSWEFILRYFDNLIQSEKIEFLDLPYADFRRLILADSLKTKSEDCVIQLIFDFINHQCAAKTYNNEDPEEKLHELLSSSRLLLASDKYLMTLFRTNAMTQKVKKVKDLIGECLKWKLETGLGCASNISNILSCERNHSNFENVLVYVRKRSLKTTFYVKKLKRTSNKTSLNGSLFKDVYHDVVTSVVCNDQIIVILRNGNLHSISLQKWSPMKLLQTGLVKQSEIENIGLILVGQSLYLVGAERPGHVYIEGCHIKFLPLKNLLIPVKDMKLIAFGTNIIIFGSANADMKTTILQCIDLQNNDHYRLDDVEGPPNHLVTFQTRRDTFFLFGTGALWQLEELKETGRLKARYLTMLWDFNLSLQGAVIIHNKLWLFSKAEGHKLHNKCWHLSVDGAFTSVLNFQHHLDDASNPRSFFPGASHFMTARMSKSVCDLIVSGKGQQMGVKVIAQHGAIMHFNILENTRIGKLMKAYCDRAGMSPEVVRIVRFSFDGIPLKDEDTPRMLGMEDGDTIDAFAIR